MSQEEPKDFDPEVDLLQRYEQMVQTQVETINSIDDKAARVSRLIGLLVGVVLSAVSLLVASDVGITTNGTLFLAHLFVSGAALVVALAQAIVTYLSSTFEYGPPSELGSFMSKYNVTAQDYKSQLLGGYSSTVRRNREVVVTNARRFQRCLASFLIGIIFAVTASVVLVGTPSIVIGVVASWLAVYASVFLVYYVTQEEYLTLDRQSLTDE